MPTELLSGRGGGRSQSHDELPVVLVYVSAQMRAWRRPTRGQLANSLARLQGGRASRPGRWRAGRGAHRRECRAGARLYIGRVVGDADQLGHLCAHMGASVARSALALLAAVSSEIAGRRSLATTPWSVEIRNPDPQWDANHARQ